MIKAIKVPLSIVFLAAVFLFAAIAVRAGEPGSGDAFTDGPSVFCHVTDGAFTDCPDGGKEWSDITPSFFDVFADVPGPESALYVDQADLDPNRGTPQSPVDHLMLMYDEMFRTTPLLPGESVHVHFMTVDEGALVHYDVWIGTNGIQKVKINGVEQVPMPSGLKGVAGYGSSPNNPLPHVMAELQIGLEAAGFTSAECCYSPDPAWWGSDVPDNPRGECPRDGNQIPPQQNNGTTNGTVGQCIPGEPVSTTAGIFTAHLNGKTTVDPEPLLPPGQEPPLCDSIKRLVEFRAALGTIDTELVALELVGSQVKAGIIKEEESNALLRCVLNGTEEGRMTGGGSVIDTVVGRVTHGFELRCDVTQSPNRLEVNWGKGNRFHLETLTHATCFDSPINQNPPAAGFDTYVGAGVGRYNGISGYLAKWVFRDAGEPGKNDTLKLVIIDPVSLLPVLTTGGNLKVGNHQAHAH